MSFDARFDKRWTDVIQPAIAQLRYQGRPLTAVRVDTRVVSDSILTEILAGVSTCRIVLADITALGKRDEYVIRNGNVMYEVGLAHAVRLPEEVVLFRSDAEQLMFDVVNVRVSTYDPDSDPATATLAVRSALVNCLNEIELRRHLAVEAATKALGADGWEVLIGAAQGMKHPPARTFGDIIGSAATRASITHLLSEGLIETTYPEASGELPQEFFDTPARELFSYRITPFGEAVLQATALKFVRSPEDLAGLISRVASKSALPPEA